MAAQPANAQPLPCEVGDEARAFRVRQQAFGLGSQLLVVEQAAAGGGGEERAVGRAAPQEIREPRAELVGAQFVRSRRGRAGI